MDLTLAFLAEIVFWSFVSLVALSETLRYCGICEERISSPNESEYRVDVKPINRFCSAAGDYRNTSSGNDSEDRVIMKGVNSYSDRSKRSMANLDVRGRVSFGRRGDNSLREIRRQQRSMKTKYAENSDNLLYYILYKRITEEYYFNLQQR